ncbi:universal stress protein [Candidatus Chloroploca sp. Khr17]|uniref:universal stress protein n=1 Tax=Candidatus Chloroploca sp. Khr17 TaxID=2496869 RepID=UPI00101D44AC|nr:universal stress protein [Candidatus Chloroploca sp. Khr17]
MRLEEREQQRLAAIEEFRRARRRALIDDLLAWMTGEPDDLLDFEEVHRRIGEQGWAVRGLRDIPIEAIVGSVGRYHDFTRHFLPRQHSHETRWANVRAAMGEGKLLPPIDVYELGGVYFVKDGNHRVSVARELGIDHLLAHVTEVPSRVTLTPDVTPDDLIIASEYTKLMEATRLDMFYPELDLRVSAPGAYQLIAEQMEQERHRIALRTTTAPALEEAAVSWYERIYLPAIDLIESRGLLRDFPGRSETDLYVWIARHQKALEASVGWSVGLNAAAADLTRQRGQRPKHIFARARERLVKTFVPEKMRDGPPPGVWRRQRLADERTKQLFHTILVPINGEAESWRALEQAIVVAHRDGGSLYGLHVIPPDHEEPDERVIATIRDRFEQRCAEEGLVGKLMVDHGVIARQICARARWADLVVMSLAHPTPDEPFGRLRSGLRDLIQRSPQPVLTVPDDISPLKRGLVAYDGSPRADEALMLAAYLALRDQLSLVVVTAREPNDDLRLTIGRAQAYLEERGIQAGYVIDSHPAAEAILRAASEHGSNLIFIGGYSVRPEVEIVIGSTVDHVLRQSQLPVLICR